MSSLYYVVLIRHAETVLPVVGVGVGQLVELAMRLIRDVLHALEMS